MTTVAQQPPSNPALDFANSILEVTNNGLELIEILRDIAEDCDEKASTNDRIAATNILNDRAFGKSPRQISHSAGLNPELAPATDGGSPKAKKEAESPRLVTQIDESLNQSIGSAPSASRQPEGAGFIPAQPAFDPNSIHFTIQQHILAITNNCQMLRDVLLEIARACPEPVEGAEDDPEATPEPRRRITPYHRRRAVAILLDRALGTDPNALWNTVCPGCRQSWTTHHCSPVHPERCAAESKDEEEPIDKEAWDRVIAELKELEKRYNLDPNRTIPRNKYSYYLPPEDYVIPPEVAAEEAAKFRAEIALRAERRKNWPKIEERRRKKLEQIYPSHSEDDGDPPDT